ncbi:MAG: hypothetical protein AAF614_03045 [Chloroflexota bacterium]
MFLFRLVAYSTKVLDMAIFLIAVEPLESRETAVFDTTTNV